jgi:Amt family ammonium transporter
MGGTVDMAVGAQLAQQAKAVGVTILWAAGGTALCCLVVRALVGLRVDERTEQAGLDLHQHGEVAYALDDR